MAEQDLLRTEPHAALREAFTHLPPSCQQLLALLLAEPPVPYPQISARLGIPVGSIRPDCSRCLDKLRRYPAFAALINTDARNAGGKGNRTLRMIGSQGFPALAEQPAGKAIPN